jgi:drug/metabolite transporter (DMT)-like permease
VLVWPGLRYAQMDWRAGGHALSGQLLGSAVCLVASLLWSGGSVLSRRSRLVTSAFVVSGWEMLFAGLFNCIPLAASGQWRQAHWTAAGTLSVAWLVIFGSLIGYTAYIYLLDHVPVARVSTYAYVNPVIAVLLGFLLLREHLGVLEVGGMVLILIAVYLLTGSKLASEQPAAVLECTDAEPAA